ncbi:hypothetical protein L1887_57802 [Cichorium endivia]|nr:hypothetical protein L1887_57802 [Cichorium endivia]
MLWQMQALLAYARAHKSVLKLRDTKQWTLKSLPTTFPVSSLSATVSRRYRHRTVLDMDMVEFAVRVLVDISRIRRIIFVGWMRNVRGWGGCRGWMGKIGELGDAVTSAHDTSHAFNAQVMREHQIFHQAKQLELKDVLATHADGQIELYTELVGVFDALIPQLERIRVA